MLAVVNSAPSPGIPRSHRFARSRPLTLKRRGRTIVIPANAGASAGGTTIHPITPFAQRKGAKGMHPNP